MCALVSSYTAKEDAPAIPSHHVPRIECLVLVITATTESSGVQWVAFLLPLLPLLHDAPLATKGLD